MFILLLFWFTVLACTAKIIKKFKLAYLNFNNNCIIIRESPTQNRKIWCKHIYPARQLICSIIYIMEHKLSGWVNVYHAWLKKYSKLTSRISLPNYVIFSSCEATGNCIYIQFSLFPCYCLVTTLWFQDHFEVHDINWTFVTYWVLLQAYPYLSSLYDTHKNDRYPFE